MNIKCVFLFSLQLLSKTFRILKRVELDIIINVKTSSCKALYLEARIHLNDYFKYLVQVLMSFDTERHSFTLTHTLTYTHLYTHPFTQLRTHTHSRIHWHTHTLIHTLTHQFTQSRSLTHSLIHTITHLLTLTHSLTHILIHTTTRSFTHTRSLNHTLTRPSEVCSLIFTSYVSPLLHSAMYNSQPVQTAHVVYFYISGCQLHLFSSVGNRTKRCECLQQTLVTAAVPRLSANFSR